MSWLLLSLLPPSLRSPRPAKVGSASDQIRGVKNRPSLIVCTFSSQRHADLGVSSCSLLNHAHVAIVSYFRCFCFFFIFVCFAISVSPRSHPETTRSVSKHTRNTLRFLNSPTVRRTPYSMRTPVYHALPSGINHQAASRLGSVSCSLRGLNDACAGRRLVDLYFLSAAGCSDLTI